MTDPARQEFEVTLTTVENGKINFKMFDRISIDDVYVHLVHRELLRIMAGQDFGVDVPSIYRDYLIRNRYSAGQR